MNKIYNSRDEKNAARRLRRKQRKETNDPLYVKELKANSERREKNREKINKSARDLKYTHPEKWKKKLLAGRKYKNRKRKKINKEVRNLKYVNPEKWKKKLDSSRKYKANNKEKIKLQQKANRRKRQDQENERRRKNRIQREALLSLLSPADKKKFLENEKAVKKASEKRRLMISKEKELLKTLSLPSNLDKKVFNDACDKAVKTINERRMARIRRRSLEQVPYIERVLQAIIDYYEMRDYEMKIAA